MGELETGGDVGTGVAGTGDGPEEVDGAVAGGVVLGVDVAGGGAGLGAAAAGAGAGGAGGAARTGGGVSATVTVPGPSLEMATKATAVDVRAKASTIPAITAGMRIPWPVREIAVPQFRHQSWSGSTGAPQVAQVVAARRGLLRRGLERRLAGLGRTVQDGCGRAVLAPVIVGGGFRLRRLGAIAS